MFTPIIFFLRWFLSQTDWETTKQSAMEAATYIPDLAISLLLTKLALVVMIGGLGLRRKVINVYDLLATLIIWFTLVALFSVIFHHLIPHDLASLKNCAITMTLAIPLSRWLGLPLAVAWNRHR